MAIQTLNPATGEIEKTLEPHSEAQVEEAIAAADGAFQEWRALSIEERGAYMRKVAEILRAKKQEYGEIMTREMGKPISQSIGEIEKCAWNCEHYTDNAANYLAFESIDADVSKSGVRFDPMGTILLVMPWNFPFWQVFRMAIPTLMAGNTVLLKHASNVPQSALAIEEIFREAGVPEGVFTTLLVGSGAIEGILSDKRVKGVSLTGSERAGSSVASIAGREIKPCVMELGGSDPFVVFEDADFALTCENALTSRLLNGGQVCISAKRFIVHRSRYDEFVAEMKNQFANYKVGDPMDPETQMGPMVSEASRAELEKQVEDSISMGATLVTGHTRPHEEGAYYAPTILTDVTPDMPVWKEETFGPAMSIIPFDTTEEAIALANDSKFGLGASVYTESTETAERAIAEIESGMVFVNGFVRTDPRLPTGGLKTSGIGRELGEYGIRAFTNVKTVWVK